MLKRIAWLVAIPLVIATTSCTQFNQLIGIVGTDYKPPVPTGAIKGTVVDRNGNKLVGAKVTNGAAVYYSASAGLKVKDDQYDNTKASTDPNNQKHVLTLGDGDFVLTKVAANTVTYVTAEFDNRKSAPIQVFVNAHLFDASQATDSLQGLTALSANIVIPVDGPVDASHTSAVKFTGTNVPGSVITAASASVGLAYSPSETVALYVQAPPGSNGTTIQASRVTYFAATANPNTDSPLSQVQVGANGIVRTLSAPVTVVPGSATLSGQLAEADVKVSDLDPTFIGYLRANSQVQAKIELFSSTDSTQALTDRSGNAISTVVTIRAQ